jgi:di/tricarboxylate transporter
VAMLIPAVNEWAKRWNLSVSKLMIPLSYAAILGGTCTLIGTSTNLIVNGLVLKESSLAGLKMFDIAWVGLPAALIGISYVLLMSRRLIPDRKPALAQFEDPRNYTVEMLVESGSPLVGRTIEEAGLRQLPNMFLAEIDREGRIHPAVPPQEELQANDRLVFVGVVESVVDLQRIRGLTPATNQVFKLDAPRTKRQLIEAVVSNSCPLVGMTIRDGQFRKVYNAVVIAVARNGERIRKKIGDIILRPGDTLLLETTPGFFEKQRNSRDFFLVSPIGDSTPPRHDRILIAFLILFGMVAAVTVGWLSMLQAAMVAAGLMIVTRCCTSKDARNDVDFQLLLVIAASFGLGKALETTGAAGTIAHTLATFAASNPWIALALIYGMTMFFTELVTNNAAAVLMFPISMAAANDLEVNPMPFVIAIMMAASASFSTPIGYQTNLMVYGPGGYRFTDYLRVGLPLNCLMWITTVLLAPLVWPFSS